MDLWELQAMAKDVRKRAACPECKKKIPQGNIVLHAAFHHMASFHVFCDRCRLEALLGVAIIHVNKYDVDIEYLGFMDPEPETISGKDVRDLGDFLKKFDGDFKTLFTKHEKR